MYAHHRRLRAFTLVEIVITALLITVASAMLIPQLTGTSSATADNQAQNTANAAVNAALTYQRGSGVFPTPDSAGAAALSGANPEITYASSPSTASTGPTNVSFSSSGSQFAVAVSSCVVSSGSCGTYNCWFERKNLAVTSMGSAPATDAVDLYAVQASTSSVFACTGANALTINTSFVPATAYIGGAWTQPIHLP